MNCPNPQCGRPVAAGSKFCVYCGSKIQPPATVVAEERTFCTGCGTWLRKGAAFCNNCGMQQRAVTPQPHIGGEQIPPFPPYDDSTNPPRKKRLKKKPIAIAAGAVVALLAIVVAVKLFTGGGILGDGSSSSGSAIVILQDGYYKLLTSVDAEESITIAALGSEDVNTYNSVTFSPDGKYIYFMTEYDSLEETGTLNRVEYSKLKSNSDNSGCVEVVGTDIPGYMYIDSASGGYSVSGGYTVLEDGTALYAKNYDYSSFDLYYFDGKKSTCICQSLEYCYYTDDEGRVIWTIYDSETYTYTIYGVKLSNPNKILALATGVRQLANWDDFDDIIYVAENEDTGAYDVYSVNFNAKSTLVISSDEVTRSYSVHGYIVAEGSVSLYSFVQDSYANSDAAATDPTSEIQSRITMREHLQDESNAIETYTIYGYINGSLTALCKNVIEYKYSNDVLIVLTADALPSDVSIDINDISYVSEVSNALYNNLDYSDCRIINLSDGKTYTIPDSAVPYLEDVLDSYDYEWVVCADYFYLFDDEWVVYAAPLSSGTLGDFTAFDIGSDASSSYYFYVYVFENRGILTFAIDSVYNREFTLYSTDGTVIYSGEGFPAVTEDAILYYSDGNLYRCISEEESILIASDVRDYFWVQNALGYDYTLS